VRQRIGYVPQELAFYKEMTTLEMATFYARIKGAPAERIEPVLEEVGLSEHLTKLVGALSGGMKQRLALGLALLSDPPLLVMDEPTSNLDTAARSQLLQLLAQVRAVMERGRLQFLCDSANLASRLGLRAQVKFIVPGHEVERALEVLRGEGLEARRNGVGVIVDVLHGEKARPIHTLRRAHIEVIDFEME
jgi:ABC-type multidrug transport system ATPase subunit